MQLNRLERLLAEIEPESTDVYIAVMIDGATHTTKLTGLVFDNVEDPDCDGEALILLGGTL